MGEKKDQLLSELMKQFEKSKNDLGFESSFDDLDGAFFISDAALSAGFVSDTYSRQLCSRIVDTYMNWNAYLNNLLMPNPGYMVSSTEAKLFSSQEDRNKIWGLIKGSMKIASTNYLVGLNKDKKQEAVFIDEAVQYWEKEFKPALIAIVGKINGEWKK